MIKLIAADLDGTLLDNQKRLPANFDAFLRYLHQKQILFVPASGRQLATLQNTFKPWVEDLALIAENGNVVGKGDAILYHCDFSPEKILAMLEEIDTVDHLYPVLTGVRTTYVPQGYPHVDHVREYYNHITWVEDLNAAVYREPICKIACIDTVDVATNGARKLSHLKDQYALIQSGDGWLDIQKPGECKGRALLMLLEKLGIAPHEAMVFGDYINDLSLMEVCPNSWAMLNGHPDLKAAANHITQKTNDANGVIHTVLHQL